MRTRPALAPLCCLVLVLSAAAPSYAQAEDQDPPPYPGSPEGTEEPEPPAPPPATETSEPDLEQEEGLEEDPDEREEPEEGSELEIDDEGFRYEASVEDDEREQAIEIEFDARSATIRVEHENETRAESRETAIVVRLRQLVEYRDLDGDGRFTSADEAVQRHAVQDLPVRTRQAAVPGTSVSVEYTLAAGGVLALDFRAVPSHGAAVKFDVRIEGYPFLENGTRLALETITSSSVEIDLEDDDEGLSSSAQGGAYYRWITQADVDGTAQTVAVSVVETKGGETAEHVVTFNYPAGRRILHDPEVGFEKALAAVRDVAERLVRGDARLFAVGVALAATLVVATTLLKLRGGRRP